LGSLPPACSARCSAKTAAAYSQRVRSAPSVGPGLKYRTHLHHGTPPTSHGKHSYAAYSIGYSIEISCFGLGRPTFGTLHVHMHSNIQYVPNISHNRHILCRYSKLALFVLCPICKHGLDSPVFPPTYPLPGMRLLGETHLGGSGSGSPLLNFVAMEGSCPTLTFPWKPAAGHPG